MENTIITERALYAQIQNLKIDSKFSYKCIGDNVQIVLQDKETNFKIPSSYGVFVKLLNEKFANALDKSKFSLISLNTAQKTYLIECLDESARCVFALDEQNGLTEQSKKTIDGITDKEFETWKQTFHVIPSTDSNQFVIYYDNKKMIIDNIIFEHIKNKLKSNEDSYNSLLEDNPFRRMIK